MAPMVTRQLDAIGEAVGKELTIIDLELIKQKVGKFQARFIRSFGDFQLPMGVEVIQVHHLLFFQIN